MEDGGRACVVESFLHLPSSIVMSNARWYVGRRTDLRPLTSGHLRGYSRLPGSFGVSHARKLSGLRVCM